MWSKDLSLIKARLFDKALSSNESFSGDRSPPENWTASELKHLKHLFKKKIISFSIQRADKGNTTVILDNISYISAIEEILNDFSNLDIPAGKEINYITILEKRISSDLKLLKDEKTIDKATYKNIKPVGSRPSVLCGLGKVHKETPIYKRAKFFIPFLTPLIQNE